jgi:hypothetical protein
MCLTNMAAALAAAEKQEDASPATTMYVTVKIVHERFVNRLELFLYQKNPFQA